MKILNLFEPKFKSNIILHLSILLILNACGKKEGPPGPAGKDGKNGNANVVSSSVSSGSWTYVAPSWEQTFTYSAITSDILNNGAVLVYVQSGSNYYQLPYTFYPSSAYSRTYTYIHYLGGLKVFVTDSDLTAPSNPGTLTFKVVVIAASGLRQNVSLDLSDFSAVKKAYNLQE